MIEIKKELKINTELFYSKITLRVENIKNTIRNFKGNIVNKEDFKKELERLEIEISKIKELLEV